MDSKAIADKLLKSRAGLILSNPFFGALALRLKMVEAPNVPTMAVDGRSIHYNPAFVDKLSMDELRGVMAHEVMHCAASHHTRQGKRKAKTWNRAADYAINNGLIAAGFKLPDGGLVDPQFDGMSAEAIYSKIHQDEDDGDDGAGDGQGAPDPGGCGAVLPMPSEDGTGPASEAERTVEENDWKVATIQAATLAKGSGKLPADIARMVEEILHPKADWRELLRRFMTASSRNDYAWTPPNRRYVHMGLYLPSLNSLDMGEVVIAVDTSGSIDQRLLAQFGGELGDILETVKPERVSVVYCDTKVNRVEQFNPGDVFTMKAQGGGGTRFTPPFDWVREQGIEPAAMIYLTDLDSSDFPQEPGFPVLWAAYGTKAQAPIGETIHLD